MVKFDFTKFDWAAVQKTGAQKLQNYPIDFKPPEGAGWAAAQQASKTSPAMNQVLSEDPSCSIVGADGITFGRAGRSKPSIFTVAAGPTAGAADGLGTVLGGGVWRSSQPQWGWYVGGGILAQTNIGCNIGLEVTYIWGPPSDLNGPSINLGIDGGVNIVTASPRLIIAIKTNPFRFDLVGISLAISAGLSVLPLNLTVELTATKIGVF